MKLMLLTRSRSQQPGYTMIRNGYVPCLEKRPSISILASQRKIEIEKASPWWPWTIVRDKRNYAGLRLSHRSYLRFIFQRGSELQKDHAARELLLSQQSSIVIALGNNDRRRMPWQQDGLL
jgi:hypothetical protein